MTTTSARASSAGSSGSSPRRPSSAASADLPTARTDAPGRSAAIVSAVAEAEGHLERAGVRDRVELREGDIFERVEADADVYTLKDILHDWDDERSLRILRTVAAGMRPGEVRRAGPVGFVEGLR
jgi:hypothetical protein